AGRLLRGLDAVGVAFLVAEAEYVGRAELARDLAQFTRIEEGAQPCAGADRPMEAALGADLEVLLELGSVEHGAAAVALLPQPLGHAALAGRAGIGADVRRHQLLQPGHAWRRIRWRQRPRRRAV